jgi:hypothetical protein
MQRFTVPILLVVSVIAALSAAQRRQVTWRGKTAGPTLVPSSRAALSLSFGSTHLAADDQLATHSNVKDLPEWADVASTSRDASGFVPL